LTRLASIFPWATTVRRWFAVAGVWWVLMAGLSGQEVPSVQAALGEFTVVPLWTEEQTPVDFLQAVGLHTKARWRQLYRPPPPTPAPDRLRSAVTLGYLMGESFLCVQAEDAQQLRNNNQEVMAYSRTLGLGEKLAPTFLMMAKLAEDGDWEELREAVVAGQRQMDEALRGQRDEDLAVIFALGVWLRVLEIVSTVVLESPEADIQGLCVGSPLLIETLRDQFAELPEALREREVALELGSLLEFLWRNWARSAEITPTSEVVEKTHDRLGQTARKLSLR